MKYVSPCVLSCAGVEPVNIISGTMLSTTIVEFFVNPVVGVSLKQRTESAEYKGDWCV